jgi:hypothetical protein
MRLAELQLAARRILASLGLRAEHTSTLCGELKAPCNLALLEERRVGSGVVVLRYALRG